MIQDQFSFSEFSFSSTIIRDLVENKAEIAEFLPHFFSLSEISEQTKRKEFSQRQRLKLVEALEIQNRNLDLSEPRSLRNLLSWRFQRFDQCHNEAGFRCETKS